jgi:MYXO-CTERM domain-containing protein
MPNGPFEPAGNVAERPYGDGVVERVTATEVGYDYSWTFSEPVEAAAVTLDLGGAVVVNVDDRGVHLDASAKPFRVSHGTWIDATGKRTPVRASASLGSITYAVPNAVFAQSRFPATLDPSVGPEWAVTTPQDELTYWGGDGSRTLRTPSGRFATFHVGGTTNYPAPATNVRYFEMVGGSQNVLSEAWVDLPSGPFEVATCDGRDCAAFIVGVSDSLAVRRLDLESLRWIDDAPKILATNVSTSAALVFDGSSYLACWVGSYPTTFCQVFDGALQPRASANIMGTGMGTLYGLSAVARPGAYVVWYSVPSSTNGADVPCNPAAATYQIVAEFIDAASGTVGSSPRVIGGFGPSAAPRATLAEGDGFLFLWSASDQLCARRLTNVGDDDGVTFSVAAPIGNAGYKLNAVSVGTRGVVANLSTYFVGNGFELATGSTSFTPHNELPLGLVAGAGDGTFLATPRATDVTAPIGGTLGYYEYDAAADIYARTKTLPLGRYYRPRVDTRVARDDRSGKYFVAWVDGGVTTRADGGILSPPFQGAKLLVNVFEPGATTPTNAMPIELPGDGTELAFGAKIEQSDLYLTWAMDAGLGMAVVVYGVKTGSDAVLAAQRIRADGTLIDASPIPVNYLTEEVTLTHGTCNYFARMERCSPHSGCFIVARDLDPYATDLDPRTPPPGEPIPFGPPVHGRLAAFMNGSTGLVDAATLSPLVVLDPSNWSPPTVSGALHLIPGTSSFIAWYEVTESGVTHRYCARLTENGALLGISDCTLGESTYRWAGSAAGKMLWFSYLTDVVARFDEGTGRMLAPLQYPHTAAMWTPQSYVGGPDLALASYLGYWPSRFGSQELDVFARWIKPASFAGESCTDPLECQSLECTNGVCAPLRIDAGAPSDGAAAASCSPSGPPGSRSDAGSSRRDAQAPGKVDAGPTRREGGTITTPPDSSLPPDGCASAPCGGGARDSGVIAADGNTVGARNDASRAGAPGDASWDARSADASSNAGGTGGRLSDASRPGRGGAGTNGRGGSPTSPVPGARGGASQGGVAGVAQGGAAAAHGSFSLQGGGCDCRVSGRSSNGPGAVLALLAVGMVASRRRRMRSGLRQLPRQSCVIDISKTVRRRQDVPDLG